MRFSAIVMGYKHPRMFFFDRKWDRLHDRRKVNPGWFKVWRRKWYVERKKEVIQLPFELPDNDTQVIEPNKMFADEQRINFTFPSVWPYEKKYEKGSPDDPSYKEEKAFYYDRNVRLWEGYKGALNFTHSILVEENELPQDITNIEQNIEIDDNLESFLDRRLNFALNTDGTMHFLPPIKEWPRMSQTPPLILGPHNARKEINILNAFYDTANLYIVKNHGLIDRKRLSWPECIFAFEREGQRCVMDLWCDFLTLCTKDGNSCVLPSLSPEKFAEPSLTRDEKLIDIHPVNWKMCFDHTHMWPTEKVISFSPSEEIHTIYLGDNTYRLKPYVDRFCKGRNLMFCYGYAAAQFRRWHGNWEDFRDPINYTELEKPILINCVDVNLSKLTMSFASFQLNTTRFDSDIKNQAWLNGAFVIAENKLEILRKFIAINLFGARNKINPKIYLEENVIQENSAPSRSIPQQ